MKRGVGCGAGWTGCFWAEGSATSSESKIGDGLRLARLGLLHLFLHVGCSSVHCLQQTLPVNLEIGKHMPTIAVWGVMCWRSAMNDRRLRGL